MFFTEMRHTTRSSPSSLARHPHPVATLRHGAATVLTTLALFGCLPSLAQTPAASPNEIRAFSLQPNLAGNIARPLRYHPDHGDFVIENGPEFFNRSLYGGNTAFRVDGGDKPEFVLYLPGRGGNLRLGIQRGETQLWLKDAKHITTRYRPGELLYTLADPAFGAAAEITLEVLAYARTEGLVVRASARNLAPGTQLLWAYGGVNGQRGSRDGDIGTERVPIGQYFQLQPGFAQNNRFTLTDEGFTLSSTHATIVGITPPGSDQHVADAAQWNNLPALTDGSPTTAPPDRPIIVGHAPFRSGEPLLLSLQRIPDPSASTPPADLNIYQEVRTPGSAPAPARQARLDSAFTRRELPALFTETARHFDALRNKVTIETPDPYLDAAMGALNVVADALWDEDTQSIMHGSIAWRTRLLGWRGPYALDALGWHDRARENFNGWLPGQNTQPIPPEIPPPDPRANLARNEPGLHSNGDLSHSHYDMNMVFIDALFRHLLWTGDTSYARQVWPAIERHLAWERRLFRREYGPDHLPLYEAYASIWASDDLYYNGGGTAYGSAYNLFANRMAARIAVLAGQNPQPYADEAGKIAEAMHRLLWMPGDGAYAEYKDLEGEQLVHPDYGLWNFYHTVDEEAVSPREAWQMGAALEHHMRAIPVEGAGVPADAPYHVFSETDWMPYSWSINNVVLDENMHTALALWQGGHAKDAFTLAKGGLLASMYMGISPGNVGTMDLYDVYRRESQRDFGDSAGIMSRALVEGLFGIHPDALAGTLTVSPGFPSDWTHARITHPDLSVDFNRAGLTDTWKITQAADRFHTLTLKLPAAFTGVQRITVNGAPAHWSADPDATGGPMLAIQTPLRASVQVVIAWSGVALDQATRRTATAGRVQDHFQQKQLGPFSWWDQLPQPVKNVDAAPLIDWKTPIDPAHLDPVDLSEQFNDSVTAIFKIQKYLSPRSRGVSLELPWQGDGAWAGHLNTLPVIDDSGLRRIAAEHNGKLILPNGVAFQTPSAAAAKNILFTSQWENYPHQVTLPLTGHASHAYFLMAGSTNFMQSHIDNGEVLVRYSDGSSARLALRNPENWWPIEQDYFIDDYQFPLAGPLPPRVNLRTGEIRLLDPSTFKGRGREVPGGAATVLDLPLDPTRELQSLTLHTLTNDVVIGLMSVTLQRP
jgi:hypothetical protein